MSSTSVEITEERFFHTLKEVVSASPDRVYKAPEHQRDLEILGSCFYVHTDAESGDPISAGCLIGLVLHRLGLPLEDMQQFEGVRAKSLLKEMFPGTFSRRALEQITQAQSNQDDGDTWGEAYVRATGETI
jgi:hypothetical protein